MASYQKFQDFVEQLGKAVHDFSTHAIKVYLSNAAPSASADAVKADLAEISGGNGYTAGGSSVTPVWSESSGTAQLAGTDVTWTASGGTIGPFQYVVLYNDTPTSPADPLIAWWDYGSALTLQIGESFQVDFGSTIFTLA
jgi:hypothetical protein